MNILVLHGPNLCFLGRREPEVYGKMTLEDVSEKIRQYARKARVQAKIFHSNCEGCLIDLIFEHRDWADGIVLNPGAYTHYGYALRDAVKGCGIPTVEVHLSDLRKREAFRRKSVIAPVCRAQVMGKGWESYIEGMRILARKPGA
jgi:3-dehydroquinate dehydratase-2